MDIVEQQPDREAQRLQSCREELVERIARAILEDGTAEPLPGIYVARLSAPLERVHSVLEPSFCVIAQGSKQIYVGDVRFRYDPFNYFLATIELPRASQVLEATRDRPYLSFRLRLDPGVVGSVLAESAHPASEGATNVRAMAVGSLDADLLDAVVRLVRLLESPSQAAILMPLITREIVYRLLMGDQGGKLRNLAVSASHAPAIAKAVDRLRRELDQPLRIEEIARTLGMSVSSFHHHFKAVTAMSPLQFQKQLRLQEARRLMLGEDLDAASAAFRVGYNDSSQFNREYKSLFGEPPIRDLKRLRQVGIA